MCKLPTFIGGEELEVKIKAVQSYFKLVLPQVKVKHISYDIK